PLKEQTVSLVDGAHAARVEAGSDRRAVLVMDDAVRDVRDQPAALARTPREGDILPVEWGVERIQSAEREPQCAIEGGRRAAGKQDLRNPALPPALGLYATAEVFFRPATPRKDRLEEPQPEGARRDRFVPAEAPVRDVRRRREKTFPRCERCEERGQEILIDPHVIVEQHDAPMSSRRNPRVGGRPEPLVRTARDGADPRVASGGPGRGVIAAAIVHDESLAPSRVPLERGPDRREVAVEDFAPVPGGNDDGDGKAQRRPSAAPQEASRSPSEASARPMELKY